MPVHKVGRGEVGVHELALAANTVDAVEFSSDLTRVEVVKDSGAAIYFTIDGSEPSIKGTDCFYLPAGVACSREVSSPAYKTTVVRLISAGTPTYSVSRVSE